MSDLTLTDRLRAHMGEADIWNVLPDCRKAADVIDNLVKALHKIIEADGHGDLPPGQCGSIAVKALAVVGQPQVTE